jgi:glycosyltransferase involved in cell wall biosynthesis
LFVHQNFPGQFLHIVRHLNQVGQHEILFISEPNANHIPGVRTIPYARPTLDAAETAVAARELDNGVRRAEAVFKVAYGLQYLGFEPDIIIGHHGWGEMLNIRDVWPKAPLLGYFEFYYRHDRGDVGFDPEFPIHVTDFARIRAKNAINHLALNLGGHGQSPTEWQRSTYPDWARPQIDLVWEGVDLTTCSPDPAARRKTLKVGDMVIKPTDKLVTYVSRDLEPYRGFHTMMRALPALMKARKDLKVIMIGGDGISYGAPPVQGGTWREVMMKEVGADIDMDRVVFPGRVPYSVYLAALRRSDAHIYLTYPFVLSWSLREAMAIGCPIIGSDTEPVRELITSGETGLLVPFLEPQAIASAVLGLLEDKAMARKLGANARAYAEKHLAMADYLASYTSLIERLTGQNPIGQQPPVATAPPDTMAPAPTAKRPTAKRPEAKPPEAKRPTAVQSATNRVVAPKAVTKATGKKTAQTAKAPRKAAPHKGR